MKRTFLAVILALSAIFGSACAQSDTIGADSDGSYIEAAALTHSEQELIYLLDNGSDVSISHFVLNHDIMHIEILVNVYQDGNLIDTKTYDAGNITPTEGKIAVKTDRSNPNLYTISLLYGNCYSEWILQADQNISGLAPVTLTDKAAKTSIIKNEDYFLFARLYSDAEALSVPSDITTNPDRLKDFKYAYMITCKFFADQMTTAAPAAVA